MSIGRSMALATVLGLSLISLSATAAAREMPLRVLLESLRQQEYDILYSSALVHQEMRVTVESVSLQALQQALPELGLRLEQRGGVWVIISAPTPPLEQPAAGADPEQAEPPENVIVTGSMHRFPTGDLVGSSRRFTPEAMNVVPVLASDAMRVALRLPGVSSVGVSAKPRIRGGLQDELLVIQDGVELLEPFHLADYHSAYSSIDRGELADILGTERIVERDISQRPEGWSGGAYLAAEWELASGLLVQPSLRWDFQDYYLQRGTEQQLSPRLGLAYELGESTRLRLSLGRFNQPEGIQELQVIDGIERFFKPQQSDQVIAGLEWDRGDLEFVAEIYYKRYRDQKGRFENMFNPFVLLPEMEPDRVGLYPQRASAQGLDLDLKVTFLPALTGQLRYSHMQAQDRIEGKWIERRWSQQHTLNASLIWQKQSYSLSAAITWHSGWRSTQLPPVVPEGVVIPVSEVLNNTLLRDYFSLDISARKSWRIGKTQLQVYADISNVTDRANVAGIDWDVDEGEDENGNIFFLLSPDSETLLKRVPSMGITLSF